jgi:uncharacterized membrane protein
MTDKIILYAVIGIVVSTVFAFLTKGTSKSVAIDQNGHYNLRMNKLYGIMGVIGLVFGLLFLIFLPLTVGIYDRDVWVGVILMLLIFWGTGIPCLMYYRNHRITFNENSVSVVNVYGKVNEIKWSSVLDIKFKALSGLLVLSTKDEIVKVHQHLVGLSEFVELIEKKTKWTRKDLKVPLKK